MEGGVLASPYRLQYREGAVQMAWQADVDFAEPYENTFGHAVRRAASAVLMDIEGESLK